MRVVVVGAGLAGLTAATDLAAAGITPIVLEASDRVGGRTRGIEVAPGAWADAGAAYLGDRHTELRALLDQLGLKTVPTTMLGASRFALDPSGHARSRDGRFPPLNAVAIGDLFDKLDELTSQLPKHAPWLHPRAAEWDTMTAQQWARENLPHPDARTFFPLFLGEMMAADPAAISVLHMAFYLRSGGGTRYLNAFEGGAQNERVDGGSHQICEQLAAALPEPVHLGDPVRSIHQTSTELDGTAGQVHVHTEKACYECDAVVVAVPPLLADQIDFSPALPLSRAGTRTSPGCAVKVHLVYPKPLWREHGLSGWSVSARGPLTSTVDDSPPDEAAGVLTGFVTGADVYEFAALSLVEQQEQARAQVRLLFPELPDPIAVHVTDWVNAPYSRGCYAALMGPGDWISRGPHLTTAHLRVHWAGTETSTEYFGLMEGAIRSGHRVATEILTRYENLRRSR
jgi:monoamine oxidase